jgi:hypothetical protein
MKRTRKELPTGESTKRLKDNEFSDLNEAFKLHDLNRDGVISEEELNKTFKDEPKTISAIMQAWGSFLKGSLGKEGITFSGVYIYLSSIPPLITFFPPLSFAEMRMHTFAFFSFFLFLSLLNLEFHSSF